MPTAHERARMQLRCGGEKLAAWGFDPPINGCAVCTVNTGNHCKYYCIPEDRKLSEVMAPTQLSPFTSMLPYRGEGNLAEAKTKNAPRGPGHAAPSLPLQPESSPDGIPPHQQEPESDLMGPKGWQHDAFWRVIPQVLQLLAVNACLILLPAGLQVSLCPAVHRSGQDLKLALQRPHVLISYRFKHALSCVCLLFFTITCLSTSNVVRCTAWWPEPRPCLATLRGLCRVLQRGDAPQVNDCMDTGCVPIN